MSGQDNNVCGIAAVLPTDSVWAQLCEMGLVPDTNNNLLRDEVRLCPKCQEQQVFYDYRANKACLACGIRLIDGQLLEPIAA